MSLLVGGEAGRKLELAAHRGYDLEHRGIAPPGQPNDADLGQDPDRPPNPFGRAHLGYAGLDCAAHGVEAEWTPCPVAKRAVNGAQGSPRRVAEIERPEREARILVRAQDVRIPGRPAGGGERHGLDPRFGRWIGKHDVRELGRKLGVQRQRGPVREGDPAAVLVQEPPRRGDSGRERCAGRENCGPATAETSRTGGNLDQPATPDRIRADHQHRLAGRRKRRHRSDRRRPGAIDPDPGVGERDRAFVQRMLTLERRGDDGRRARGRDTAAPAPRRPGTRRASRARSGARPRRSTRRARA